MTAGDDKTLLARGVKPDSAAATKVSHFTQFAAGSAQSTGFAEAHSLAQQSHALSGTGSLIKKRFLLGEVIGEGGMGIVYKTKDLRKVEAEDPNPFIATKILSEGFKQHPSAFVTLQQETAKSQTLAHPNIVTVHDFDREGDVIFMTMELLEGKPLDKLLQHGITKKWSKDQAFQIVEGLCAALSYAHKRHIIHADFKPGNVFICDDGTAKVLDFGIARAASKETQKHKFDAAQLGALTPAYSTIEMMRDEAMSYSDDVYALACVIYEMLSGVHPYQQLSALDAKQRQQKLVPVNQLAKVQLSAAQWRALQKALSVEKNQRFSSVDEFHAAFFPRRNSGAVYASVAAAIAGLAGAVWFGFSQYQAQLQLEGTINTNLEQAQLCFAQRDFACTLEKALVVKNLAADNKAAMQLINAATIAQQQQINDEKIKTLLDDGEACLAQKDDACAQVKAKEVIALDATNVRAKQLLASAENLELNQAVIDTLQQGQGCLQAKDLICAELFLRKASEQSAEHPAVKQFEQKLAAERQVQKQVLQQQQLRVSALLEEAQECFNAKRYDCAVEKSSAVLALDPANAKAVEVKQSAAVIQQQAKDAESKVVRIIQQARDCLEKQKNYSCAIAKAESALDLVPGNPDALTIKSKAQEVQRKIKETGFTIK